MSHRDVTNMSSDHNDITSFSDSMHNTRHPLLPLLTEDEIILEEVAINAKMDALH